LLPGRSHRSRLRALAALVLVLAGASPATAFEVAFDGTRRMAEHLWADIRLTDVLPERVEESLGRGMPATLEIHSELWRKRTAWFDRLEDSFDAELRVRYDVWSKEYRIERRGLRPETFDAFEALEAALMRPMAIKVGRLERLQPGGRYYVVVTATLRPLDVEDAEQVEGWLSGEVDTNRKSGFGVITELPRSLFDAVRNLAGFGDVRARAFCSEITITDVGND
jgi:hypothetical protein